jgi:glycosyltransferase involved in cell wall biosynthesis
MATVEPRKQQSILVEAFSRVAQEHDRARLLLVGDMAGTYSELLHRFVKMRGLTDRVKMISVVPDSFPFYGIADVLVLASEVESMPRSLLEGMCFGIPSVACSVFGVPELIRDTDCGFLCSPASINELSKAIGEVLSTPHLLRARIGESSRQLILHDYDSVLYAEDYLSLVSSFISAPGAIPTVQPRAAKDRTVR